MARIVEIKTFKVILLIECDCGNTYKWTPNRVNCPKCGTEHELVLAPKSIPKIRAIDEIKKEGDELRR
jgi:hypothetical protein